MDTIQRPAATKLSRGAAMGRKNDKKGIDEVLLPVSEDEAVQQAVTRTLQAASLLLTAADLAEEGVEISYLINTAIRLRDLANSLSPDKPDWPTDGAAIYDIRTKEKLN